MFEFDRLRPTSIDFDRVRRSSTFSVPVVRVVSRTRTDSTEPTRQRTNRTDQPHRLTAAGAIRVEFIPRCQRSIVAVRFGFENPGEPWMSIHGFFAFLLSIRFGSPRREASESAPLTNPIFHNSFGNCRCFLLALPQPDSLTRVQRRPKKSAGRRSACAAGCGLN